MMRKEEEETLWEAFGSLPGRYQVLLRLLFADPAPTYQEISSVTGMPVGSIGPLFGDDALPSSVSVPRAQTGVRHEFLTGSDESRCVDSGGAASRALRARRPSRARSNKQTHEILPESHPKPRVMPCKESW